MLKESSRLSFISVFHLSLRNSLLNKVNFILQKLKTHFDFSKATSNFPMQEQSLLQDYFRRICYLKEDILPVSAPPDGVNWLRCWTAY